MPLGAKDDDPPSPPGSAAVLATESIDRRWLFGDPAKHLVGQILTILSANVFRRHGRQYGVNTPRLITPLCSLS
jgi:hypothetical protein